MLITINGISKCLGWAIGGWEIAAILILALLLFGGKKLPELAKGLARGLKIFKSEMRDVKNHVEDSTCDEDDSSTDKDSKDADEKKS